jgi:sodium-dependent dicarboxylate transporter 2/3/5
MIVAGVIACVVLLASNFIADPVLARAAVIAGVCLTLWLGEAVPTFVPTLVLWALTPLLLGSFGTQYRLASVLGWSADPVLALFLGGFTLSVAANRYGLDEQLARMAVRLARGNRASLLILTATATAVLSMWISNIAAAAMMIAAMHPLLAGAPRDDSFRRALLVGIALGANFGGIATPIGTGPNAIAIAAVSRTHTVTFLDWMVFAFPLAFALLAAGVLFLIFRFRVRGGTEALQLPEGARRPGARGVLLVFLLTVVAWLTEPLHGAPASIVALLATIALFASGLLEKHDLARIDWATLVLIAGGIGLGNLLEQTGAVSAAASVVPWEHTPSAAGVFLLCFASALLSALMSNTAAATMLIPLAASLDPSPSTAILIAVAASLGIPFVISTPPNAMVFGEGGVRMSDLLVPGLLLMLGGCLVVSLTGRFVLNLLGIP